MSRFARDMYRKRLRKALAAAPDEGLLELVWATNALQSGQEAAASKVLGKTYPPDAATDDMTSKHAIHKWELETVVNEALTIPKHLIKRGGKSRSLNCNNFASISMLINWLRKLEDYEYGVFSDRANVLREMYRIAGRQFDWQRGYFNIPQFYRAAYIYGQGRCAEYLSETFGTSLAEMSLVGFAIYTSGSNFPAFTPDLSVEEVGLTTSSMGRVLAMVSRPIEEVRKMAAEQRTGWQITAYRPSILRRYPCIAFHGGSRILCPLPELILERVTSGIFYDVIGGGGEIRHEYGRRFEEYALRYIQAQAPGVSATPEWSYRADGQTIHSPDIIVQTSGGTNVAIECKASRMSFAARFSETAEAERGYDDIVKGVFQLWRFFSHCRRGLTGVEISDATVGMLLTLDSWLVMGGPVTHDILQRARAMADAKDKQIQPEDRKFIVFSPIADLETVLAEGDEALFIRTLCEAALPKYDGWMLSGVSRSLGGERPRKPYPFDDISELLPWWGQIDEKRRQRQSKLAH